MRILVLVRDRSVRARDRMLQFLPHLARAGHHVHVCVWRKSSHLERLLTALRAWFYELVWIEGPLRSWPGWLRAALPKKRLIDLLPEEVTGDVLPNHHFVIVPRPPICDSPCEVIPWSVPKLKHVQATADAKLAWFGHEIDASMANVLAETAGGPVLFPFLQQAPSIAGLSTKLERLDQGFHQLTSSFQVGLFPASCQQDPSVEAWLLRCFSSGIPVLVARQLQQATLVEEARAGYVVEANAPWFHSIQRLVDNPELCATLGDNGRQWVDSFREPAYHAHQLLGLLERIKSDKAVAS